MIGLALLLQVAVSPTPVPASADDIIVTARNVASAKNRLDACIVRKCPPNEEIKAALVYATRQFLAGDYGAARGTLLSSRHRNAKFANAYPIEVSDLHRALNTLSNLDGRQTSARISAFDATDALRAGLAPDDPLILLQRLDTAQQLAREGRLVGATQIINDVAAKAHDKQYYGVEAQALFRGATLYAAVASVDSRYRASAKVWRNRIEKRTDVDFGEYRDALRLLDVQLTALATKPSERPRLLADVKPIEANEAVLLDEPEAHFSVSEMGDSHLRGGNSEPEWADVAFWVRPDGTVADTTIIGQSESPPGSWLATKIKAVAARRYVPLAHPADPRGLYRVERYSMVYDMGTSIESRIPSRSARGRLQTTDITAVHRLSAAPAAGTS